jgi:hypothetical protein
MGWLDEVKAKGLGSLSLACPDGCLDLCDAGSCVVVAGFSERVRLYADIFSAEVAKRSSVALPVLSDHEFKVSGSYSQARARVTIASPPSPRCRPSIRSRKGGRRT